jgi:hypothetical protein
LAFQLPHCAAVHLEQLIDQGTPLRSETMQSSNLLNPRQFTRLSVAALLLGFSIVGARSQADAQAQNQNLKAACGADAARLCGNVLPGGGRRLACLQQQQSQLGADCRAALPIDCDSGRDR